MEGVWYRANDRPIVWDLTVPKQGEIKGVVVFIHGYKGFKDWGGFKHMGAVFAQAGLALLKFNFSHNGGTATNPIDFPDLEAFGHNTFSKEKEDLRFVSDQLDREVGVLAGLGNVPRYLIGHSRGGGIAILSAEELPFKKVVTWASVCDFAKRFPNDVSDWEKAGVAYIENARTKQQMPHYFSFYQDFAANKDDLDVGRHASHLTKPWLIVHGSADETVLLDEAMALKEKGGRNARLEVIDGGSHTFGLAQPWMEEDYPEHFQTALKISINFLMN